jgi:hypothetical protein
MRTPAFLAWKIEYEKPFIRYQLVEEMIARKKLVIESVHANEQVDGEYRPCAGLKLT